MYNCLKLKNQLCFPIYLCSKEIIRKYASYLDELNLTYTQYVVMMYLWEYEYTNVSDLGGLFFLIQVRSRLYLKKLELKGYIKRNRSLNDERVLEISLTSYAKILKDKVLGILKKVE